ncbi:hypothetical protein BUALT_Bualt05G0130600 [Buddleja alternifolia]|uniref:Uncharacterized protein n=1 Tax=Buddleja alternifolia TaxID=168488 RepID=A0AAV6XIV6_9LAMI|nr:hypothetical protein BUALT_Bualt05G0130600 [Buddleja alternifolia]
MNFHSSLRQEMQDSGEEDDVFYDELRRQVLQLTAEDDDHNVGEDIYENNNLNMVEVRKQGPNNGPRSVSQPRCYYNWPENKEDCAAPAWILNLWRTGNGTGVFIPQTVQTRRKNRSRRKKNERGRTYKLVETMN